MTLNALEVDPGRVWKGPWKWYHESMLDCCKSLVEVKKTGINLDQFVCLARCNRLTATKTYAPDQSSLDFDVQHALSNFRCAVVDSVRSDSRVVAVSYNRQVLQQTGTGHFSTIGGYHEGSDKVLILDVARFKYPPHWVQIATLFEAMRCLDYETNKPRGYVLLSLETDAKPLVLLKLVPHIATMRKVFELVGEWISEHWLPNNEDCDEESIRQLLDYWHKTFACKALIDFRDGLDFHRDHLILRCPCIERIDDEHLRLVDKIFMPEILTLSEFDHFCALTAGDRKLAFMLTCTFHSWPFELYLPRKNVQLLLKYRQSNWTKFSQLTTNELAQLKTQMSIMLCSNTCQGL